MATTETMTVHKALAELKVLDKRIQDAMLSTYVGTKKNNQDKVLGYTPDQFNEHVKNQFTKVCDLIRRRNALKDAVNVSNANTVVTIGGKEYTVVQAIDKKNHGMEYYIQLHNLLASELADAKKEMETKNASLQQKAEAFVTNLMGNKDTKVNSDEYDKAVKTYITSNTVDIIDPLGIEKKIAELEEMINSFMPEVDSALSCSNALTTITIQY